MKEKDISTPVKVALIALVVLAIVSSIVIDFAVFMGKSAGVIWIIREWLL